MNPAIAEQAVLGGLMIAGDQAAALASLDWLAEADFGTKRHQLIWRAIVEQVRLGREADAVTMGEWFEKNGIAQVVGGSGYILELANNTPSAANITAYAEIVAEASRKRALAALGETIAAQAVQGQRSAGEIALAHHAALLAMTDTRRRQAQGMAELARRTWREMQDDFERQGPRGIVPPWPRVAALVPDVRGGEYVVIGGRPGMGKSTFGLQFAQASALSSRHTRWFVASLEMPGTQMTRRMLASASDVPLRAIRNPEQMQDEHWPRLTAAMPAIQSAPILIDDQPGLTAEQVCARARRAHLRAPLGGVLVDHFHRMKFPGKDTRHAMDAASSAFKDLALELNVPVVVLVQLNRAVEKQGNQRPSMADIRECGAIEQDADWIVLLYRDEYYNPESPNRGVLEAIVAKARDGETGTASLAWRGDVSRIDDLPDLWAPQSREPSKFKRRGFA